MWRWTFGCTLHDKHNIKSKRRTDKKKHVFNLSTSQSVNRWTLDAVVDVKAEEEEMVEEVVHKMWVMHFARKTEQGEKKENFSVTPWLYGKYVARRQYFK